MTVPDSDSTAAPLVLSLFGPLQVLVDGQPLPRVRSRKGLWLLALLTLRHGRPVEREWLAGTLWPDIDQSQAFANLRPILSELRRALGSSHGARLQSPTRHTISLDLAGVEVDLHAFDAAVADGNLPALEQAVALYCGPLLEGCAEEWVFQEREAREQECLKALRALGEAALAGGDYTAARDYYQRAAALDPLGEAARRGLMEALAKSGDINAALQVYREFVERLRGDMGAAPDPQTTALYARLREQVSQKAVTPIAAAVSQEAATIPVVSGYLPHPLTDLVGREDERLEVAERLQRARLVTLTGPGGVGKTRLAAAVAGEVVRQYPDGVWLVPLEALPASGDGDEGTQAIVQQIASVLEVKGGRRALVVNRHRASEAQASTARLGQLRASCRAVRHRGLPPAARVPGGANPGYQPRDPARQR